MNKAFSFLSAACVLIICSASLSFGQTPSATPDPFVAEITSSLNDSFVNSISGNGRFVVIESTGDIATEQEKTSTRNNLDGNREIFLYDYAQRRIFQITNTRNVLKPATPTPTPSPTPTPTASPAPTPITVDPNTVAVSISNNRPVISNDGKFIVFSSNAPNPGGFDGSDPNGAVAAKGNQEIWIYQLPAFTDVDLTRGSDVPAVPLDSGTFIRVTNTPASRIPQPGTTTTPPFFADDNRDAAINDDGSIIAFVSTRDLVTGGNTDFNPEIFVFNRITGTILQVTNTSGALIFNENPSLSGDGSVLAFISNASITGANNDDGKGNGNAEIYLANFNGTTVSNLRQLTNTKTSTAGVSVNLLSLGNHLSRNGKFLAFESTSADPKNNGANQAAAAIFLYDIGGDTLKQVVPPAPVAGFEVLRFPTFTGDSSTLVFTSKLNLKPDATLAVTATDGINQGNLVQVFSVPVATPNVLTRLTNTLGTSAVSSIQPFVSNTTRRVAFSFAGELGGGKPGSETEAFYLLVPPNNTETAASANALNFFTGASLIPVASASPTPTPSPSPAATPVPGVSAGEITVAQSAVALAPSPLRADSASETVHHPPLPVELNGVSISVNGAAAGLYAVDKGTITFVVPPGLTTTTNTIQPVVVNNNGSVIRSTLTIVASQPDIFPNAAVAGNRAAVLNVTNQMAGGLPEPFSVTSSDGTNTVPTRLEIAVTGLRGIQKAVGGTVSASATVTVTIGTVDITGDGIISIRPNTNMFGEDLLDVQLPASLAGAGDVPVIVKVVVGGQTFTSRAADTAPHITIN